jgi:dolichyl-phosphate-mannose-protein mannosyltransferase
VSKLFESLSEKFISLKLEVVAPYMVLLLGFMTYFFNYQKPAALFWDENYYVSAATKYEKKVFFQEPHPPWGKLLIAAGNKILDPNPGVHVDFEQTDYTKSIPVGYSFKGFRFFPALFAWLNSGLFYSVALTLTQAPAWALTLSTLYLLDNALIVHSRGTMLDSIQLFGVLLALLGFFKMYRRNEFSTLWMIMMSTGIAWATWTKLNGLVLILLVPGMLLLPKGIGLIDRVHKAKKSWGIGALVFLFFTIFVWQLHFSLGQNIEPKLNRNGWYQASDELIEIKTHPENNNNFISNFYIQFRDYMKFIGHYEKGVPKLDLCKKGENGSPFYWWPFGAKTINYRWETKDSGKSYSYLYLQVNPIVWGFALISVLLTFAYFIMRCIFEEIRIPEESEKKLFMLFSLYVGYMVAIARIDRVMYLYHYFIPLVFSFVMVMIWLPYLTKKIFIPKFKAQEILVQVIFITLITSAYLFYRPFSYYEPINCESFKARNIFPGWMLKGINCE